MEKPKCYLEFIAHCYESGSLIIGSNPFFSQWDQIFPDTLMTVVAHITRGQVMQLMQLMLFLFARL